jgi:subtilisin family serine protease
MRRAISASLVLSAVAAAAAVAAPSSPTVPPARWVRVQLADRVTPEQVDALHAAGLEALQYVPENAYVGVVEAGEHADVARVAGVTRVSDVSRDDKLDDSLLSAATSVRTTVVAFRPESALDRAVAALGGVRHVGYALGDGGAAVREYTLPVAVVRTVAARDDVLLVTHGSGRPETEDEAAAQTLAKTAAGANSPRPGYEKFLKSVGATGKGVTIAIVDEGVDPNHPDLAGRIVRRYEHSPVPAEGHGTHVAGIAGGIGATLPVVGRAKDSQGLLYGLGIAPGVRFVDINAISTGADFPPADGFGIYTRQALASGASIWNASWTSGEGPGAGYVANAANLDQLTRDADDRKAGLQPFTFVFSAGNSGGPEARITGPKEAKNIISVASSIQRGSYPIGTAPDDERLSTFSSRGPARDGRILPTVTAPGQNIASTRATTGATCGTSPPPDGFLLYSLCSGTSMASPQVTGAVALLTEWWRARNRGATPSPAMVKALLVNTAVDMGEPNVPNIDEGWGRVSTGLLLDPKARRVTVDQKVVLTRRDQAYSVRVVPVDPRRPMKVTLVWTDPAGVPQERRTDRDTEEFSPPALVNDLNLSVAGKGGPFLGNVLSGGFSVRGGTADRLNNVEGVHVQRPSGAYTVTVKARNLPGDAIPGNSRRTEQDFALVISNARLA